MPQSHIKNNKQVLADDKYLALKYSKYCNNLASLTPNEKKIHLETIQRVWGVLSEEEEFEANKLGILNDQSSPNTLYYIAISFVKLLAMSTVWNVFSKQVVGAEYLEHTKIPLSNGHCLHTAIVTNKGIDTLYTACSNITCDKIDIIPSNIDKTMILSDALTHGVRPLGNIKAKTVGNNTVVITEEVVYSNAYHEHEPLNVVKVVECGPNLISTIPENNTMSNKVLMDAINDESSPNIIMNTALGTTCFGAISGVLFYLYKKCYNNPDHDHAVQNEDVNRDTNRVVLEIHKSEVSQIGVNNEDGMDNNG